MDFTFEIHNNLDPMICKNIIKRFENDDRKQNGVTYSGYNPLMKNSLDLYISRLKEWDDVTEVLDKLLKENMKVYQANVMSKLPLEATIMDTWHNGYQIQKSGHYRWHHDALAEYGRERVLTFIWYLNTIDHGGHTGFLHKTVKPEEGKFVFFPATWDYFHCGFAAVNKYIITGWTWRDQADPHAE
jgi:2OG-Fe(II) oxygenase superfamily